MCRRKCYKETQGRVEFTIFWGFFVHKNVFKKLECHFLVESTKIEWLTFWYKTALSESNSKRQIEWGAQNVYHKKRSFTSNYFMLLKNLFQCKNLLLRVGLWYQRPKCPYPYFLKALEFYLRVLFSLWVSLSKLKSKISINDPVKYKIKNHWKSQSHLMLEETH